RAIYVVEGEVRCDARAFQAGTMFVLREKAEAEIVAERSARVMLVGGATLKGERHIYWNFVSSATERIDRRKDAGQNRRFAKVSGDEVEFIPLPERLNPSKTTA